MRFFDTWLSKRRREKGGAEAPDMTPVQDLQLSMIVIGEWLLVLGEKLVKVASKRKPRAADVREIADGFRAAADVLDKAAERYELARRGLKA